MVAARRTAASPGGGVSSDSQGIPENSPGSAAGAAGGGAPGGGVTGLPQCAPQQEKERPDCDPGSAPAAWTKAGETELHHVVEC